MQLVQVQQQVVGGVTQSVFPTVERMLDDPDNQEALKFVARRKNMDRYESVIDFLFCETFTGFRGACQRFYAGNGPRLLDMTTQHERDNFEARLLVLLAECKLALAHARKVSWGWVVARALAA